MLWSRHCPVLRVPIPRMAAALTLATFCSSVPHSHPPTQPKPDRIRLLQDHCLYRLPVSPPAPSSAVFFLLILSLVQVAFFFFSFSSYISLYTRTHTHTHTQTHMHSLVIFLHFLLPCHPIPLEHCLYPGLPLSILFLFYIIAQCYFLQEVFLENSLSFCSSFLSLTRFI